MSASATPAVTTPETTAPETPATAPAADTTAATPETPPAAPEAGPVPVHLTGGPSFDMPYEIHPIAELNPPQSAEELAATEASIRATGFKAPVTFWVDGRGQNMVIDGRTRMGIMEKLHRAGITLAENGAPLVPEVAFFEGSESEALAHARTLNLRRNLESGQRAAVAVLSGMMERVLKTQETGADPALLAPEPEGELAKRVAATAGTNSEYIYRCIELGQKYPDLLHAVRDGKLTVPKARKIMERRKEGLSDEPDPNGEPVETPVEKPTEVTDALRNVVHEDHRDTFASRKQVAKIKKDIGKVMEEIKELVAGAGGWKFVLKEMISNLGAARRHLDNHQPHVVCPVCMGTGEDLENPTEKCGKCGGHCYLDKLQYKELEPEYKSILEGNLVQGEVADQDGDDHHEDAEGTPAAAPAAAPAPKPEAKPKPAAKPKPPAKPKPAKPAASTASAPAAVSDAPADAVGPAPASAPTAAVVTATTLDAAPADAVPPPDDFADAPPPAGGDDDTVPPPLDL